MELVDLKNEAETLFQQAAARALCAPGEKNPPLQALRQLCWRNYAAHGFACMADCFAAVVPHIQGRLTLEGWSVAEMTVAPWTFRVVLRPFWLGSDQVHIAIHHDGPLPNVTETGYRSIFAPISTFRDGVTPEEFIREIFPQTAQMSLF
ncbi:MAG TPA: hypothetical protein VF258_09070 [Luteolibacter sp.]